MSESTPEILTHIETTHGNAVPLPYELRKICCEEQKNIYLLAKLLNKTQIYLTANKENKAATLRDTINILRDLSAMYQHLKETFIDFAVNNASGTTINGDLKTKLLLDWIDKDEEIIRYVHEKEEAREKELEHRIRNYVSDRTGDVMRKIDKLLRFNTK